MPDQGGVKNKAVKKRERVDYTKERASEQRILDSLAKVLAARSECIAVVIVNQQLYIASNDLFIGSQTTKNKNYKSIMSIIGYFRKIIANNEAEQENMLVEKEHIFCEVIAVATRYKFATSKVVAREIAKNVMQGMDPTISEIRFMHKHSSGSAAQMYNEFTKLYKHFIKLETELRQNSSALKKVFNKDIKILQEQKVAGVHAEMQLLAKIVSFVNNDRDFVNNNKNIYIGISKLCCLHCRCMLQVANDRLATLAGDQILLLIRGHHDLDFENWICPDLFLKGYNSVRSSKYTSRVLSENDSSMEFLIGSDGRRLIQEYLQDQQPKSDLEVIDMDPDSSSSEASIIDSQVDQAHQALLRHWNFIEKMKKHGFTDNYEKLVLIAITMHELKSFHRFCKQITELDSPSIKSNLLAILGGLQKKLVTSLESEITLEDLKTIMQTPIFVGKKLAKIFNKQEQPTKEPHSLLFALDLSLAKQEKITKTDSVARELSCHIENSPSSKAKIKP